MCCNVPQSTATHYHALLRTTTATGKNSNKGLAQLKMCTKHFLANPGSTPCNAQKHTSLRCNIRLSPKTTQMCMRMHLLRCVAWLTHFISVIWPVDSSTRVLQHAAIHCNARQHVQGMHWLIHTRVSTFECTDLPVFMSKLSEIYLKDFFQEVRRKLKNNQQPPGENTRRGGVYIHVKIHTCIMLILHVHACIQTNDICK